MEVDGEYQMGAKLLQAVKFTGNLELQNLVFYFNVTDVAIDKTKVTEDHMKLDLETFEYELQDVIETHIVEFNQRYIDGVHIGEIDP